MQKRTETDQLGSIDLPKDCLWGIHTARAIDNFPFKGTRVPQQFIQAYAQVKRAACRANTELGYLGPSLAIAIEASCCDLIEGRYFDAFPLPAMQGGAGTSLNMNVNEVLANLTLLKLGHQPGEYEFCHPIEHINLHQSTNDTYPTALKVAAIYMLREAANKVAKLQGALQRKEQEFAGIAALGRTEWQEAVPVSLGAKFGAFAEAIARDRWRLFKCEERLRVVNLGGTAVGTGLTAPRSYIFLATEKLRELTGLGLARAENMVDATANADPFVEVSGILSAAGVNLIKVSSDLRHLHGLGEIHLPAVQAGSSIMPGKVNPVIAEAAISAGLKLKANHQLVSDAASMATLQIPEFLPLLASALLESLELCTTAATILAEHVDGIEGNEQNCLDELNDCPTIITALLPQIGYEKAEQLLKSYQPAEQSFREFLNAELGPYMVTQALSPYNLNALGYRDDAKNT